MASERTFACRGGEYFADGKPIDPLVELVELEGELERLRGELAVERHENSRWEGICDELERERDEARQLARMYWQRDRRHQLTFEQDHLSERHPWLTEEQYP